MASKSRKRRKQRQRSQGADAANGADAATAAAAPRPVAAQTSRRRPRGDEPPPAPWGSFPLVELTVLVGLIMIAAGLLLVSGQRGVIFIGTGMLLASIGGLELSIREHFAGYRSHTLILAGVPSAIVLGVLFYAGPTSLSGAARAGIGLAVFGLTAWVLTRVFRERSGGLSFRFSGLRRR